MSLDMHLHLQERELSPFRDALDASSRSAATRNPHRLVSEARQQLHVARESSAAAYLGKHLDAMAQVIAFLEDREFSQESSAREAALGALAYFVEPNDLIPDSEPKFGLLDDSIVLNLAIEQCRSEWHAWAEYAQFKQSHPQWQAIDRDDWMRLRQEELALALRYRQRRARRSSESYLNHAELPTFKLH